MSNISVPPRKWLPVIIVGAIVMALLIIGGIIFGTYQGVKNKGIRQEARLTGLYQTGEITLSSCVTKTVNSVGVANAQTSSLVKVYAAAIGSRNQSNDAAIFTALKEAYPNTSGLDKTYQNVLSVINGCRDDYAGAQTNIQQAVVDFNQWRNGSFATQTFGGRFPDDNLTITIANQTFTGQAALDKIDKPIVDTVTNGTYQTGTYDPTDPFGTSSGK